METLLSIIDKIINPVIWILAVVVLGALIYISRNLQTLKDELTNRLYGIKGSAAINPKTLALKQRDTALAKREELYPLRKKFDELCSQYLTWAQVIPIFPLLGILGTVAGLMRQVTTQDASAIYSALHLALSSTLWGLLASIVLKIVEAAVVTRNINDIETMLSDYDIKYQDAKDLRDFDGE